MVTQVNERLKNDGRRFLGLINNAGIQVIDPMEYLTPEDLRAGLEGIQCCLLRTSLLLRL